MVMLRMHWLCQCCSKGLIGCMMIFFVKLSLKSNVRGLPLLLVKCCSIHMLHYTEVQINMLLIELQLTLQSIVTLTILMAMVIQILCNTYLIDIGINTSPYNALNNIKGNVTNNICTYQSIVLQPQLSLPMQSHNYINHH